MERAKEMGGDFLGDEREHLGAHQAGAVGAVCLHAGGCVVFGRQPALLAGAGRVVSSADSGNPGDFLYLSALDASSGVVGGHYDFCGGGVLERGGVRGRAGAAGAGRQLELSWHGA